ncbi:hypothetical protein BYT27DRAFT_7340118 [Phlegmacium glaucopus]|nr:hypothetical protein BYT27DRAFT_7340118 [Phlegmacium glaucopus]
MTIFLLYHGWARLSAFGALAPEFYDNIPSSHPSCPMVIVNFIRDEEVGKFEREKRLVNNGSAGHADLLGKTTLSLMVYDPGRGKINDHDGHERRGREAVGDISKSDSVPSTKGNRNPWTLCRNAI